MLIHSVTRLPSSAKIKLAQRSENDSQHILSPAIQRMIFEEISWAAGSPRRNAKLLVTENGLRYSIRTSNTSTDQF